MMGKDEVTKTLTPEEVDKAIEERPPGATVEGTLKALGVDRSGYFKRKQQERGGDPKNGGVPGYDDEFRAKVVHAYLNRAPGESAKTIAARFKVSVASVSFWARIARAASPNLRPAPPKHEQLELRATGRKKLWTEEKRQQVLAGLRNVPAGGVTAYLDSVGVGRSTIYNWPEWKTFNRHAHEPTGGTKAVRGEERSEHFREAAVHAYRSRAPGVTADEIADRLSISVGTLKKWIARADQSSLPRGPRGAHTKAMAPVIPSTPADWDPESKTVERLRKRIEELEQQLSIVRPIAEVAVKRGLLSQLLGG